MNLQEINILITALKNEQTVFDNAELIKFYEGKRTELIQAIKTAVAEKLKADGINFVDMNEKMLRQAVRDAGGDAEMYVELSAMFDAEF